MKKSAQKTGQHGAAWQTSLHALIEAQVARTPHAMAVRCEQQALSYAELDARANRCAHYLRELGVGPDVVVGVLMERSIELMVALLAILKAGGAYLPLDPAYPDARLAFLLDDAGVPVVLTQGVLRQRIGEGASALALDTEWSHLEPYPDTAPVHVNTHTDLAYVIYTSGSTGQPKGCMLPHGAICNRLQWMQSMYGLIGEDRVLQKTPYTFDVSVWEFFWPLLAGATLVFAAPQGHKDANYLAALVRREGITVCHFVPSMLRFFLGAADAGRCTSLRDVFVSGEALPLELLQRFRQTLQATRLHNLYGPTEAAVDVSYWACEERSDGIVPIGRAIDNVQLHILDEHRRPVAAGQEGELHVAGVCLARGYLNRPELTAERFIESPFANGERLYRTGDRARELADGNIEYLGRLDFQVKLRGLRIELGEIEATLREWPGVSEAAVVVRGEEEGDPKLVAYLESAKPQEAKAVRRFVADRLPEYMVPSMVVSLPRLPVTVHGKLERAALPWPVGHAPDAVPAALPVSPVPVPVQSSPAVEQRIAALMAQALRVDTVQADGDLFDMGATSLTMVQVVERIQQEYGVAVPVDVFLDAPTVHTIATYVSSHGALPDDKLAQAPAASGMPCAADGGVRVSLPGRAVQPWAFEAGRVAHRFDVQTPLPHGTFAGWLGLLCATRHEDSPKYRYPSAGGLNPVRTYVTVREKGVEGLSAGTYYLHPEHHALYRVGPAAWLRDAFHSQDRALVDEAGFAVFFIAALDAIEPLYQDASATLVTLEAGYMAQLLLSRQAEFGVGVRPMAGLDFDTLRGSFDLAPGERFVHGLFGGAPGAGSQAAPPIVQADAAWQARADAVLEQLAPRSPNDPKNISAEVSELLDREQRHLRQASGPAHALPAQPLPGDAYRLRTCRREYEAEAVPLGAVSGLLTLCRASHDGAHLYASATGRGAHSLSLRLYVKEGGVKGLDQGVYAYDAEDHELVRIGGLTSEQMALAYTPFNRKHYKTAGFALFVFEAEAGKRSHDGLLQAGGLGQVLMERQAELGLGLCPIGGLRFDKVEAAFGVPAGTQPLHSFMGGLYRQAIPAGHRWMLADVAPAESTTQGIAIVGMSARFPGAADLQTYWRNLRDGQVAIGPLPSQRAPLLGQADARHAPVGGYLNDIACFDSMLFRIPPAQARSLDPQERLLLETAWACLEDAGYTAPGLLARAERVGVFVGAMWNDYQSHGVQAWLDEGTVPEASHHASLANRISHVFNFSGPSVAINTSCSSAMTALHFACESIKRGECDAALVGGVNLVSHAYHAGLLEGVEFLSSDGCCRPFSANANGWVVGEGVGAVLLRPLAEAQRDADPVRGVIRGSAIGHSGRTMRYGAPSARQQAQGMRRALASAGVQAGDIAYVEAAAPGASLADATEVQAIREVFGDAGRSVPCRIGTVKANIGHLESASALSQLAKVLAQLNSHEFAPSLNSQPRNPLIEIDGSGLAIVDALTPWPSETPRRALINVIGAAGSAGHVVVEEYLVPARTASADRPTVVQLSAATPERLQEHAARMRDFMVAHPDAPLADIAHTLRVGRVEMAERLALVVDSTRALAESLTAYVDGRLLEGVCQGKVASENPPVASTQDLHALAGAWVQGAAAAWPIDPQARRLAMPAYPFEPARHWIGWNDAQGLQEIDRDQAKDQGDHPRLQDATEAHLRAMLVRVTELPAARVELDLPLEDYGLDSMMVHALNAQLEGDLGKLPATLFFEHRTLRALAQHLVEHCSEALHRRFELSPASPAAGQPLARRGIARAGRARAQARPVHREQGQDIAIIGLAGRYPKARDVHAYWRNLVQGLDCITEIPAERWDHARYFDPRKGQRGKSYSKWGGFIDGADEFDPLLFNISPRDAEVMDPQERLFLQTVWETFEDAGYNRESLGRRFGARVGVFAGVMYSEYQLYPGIADGLSLSSSIGTIANRVSYVLD
ncbi:MAG: amino acid adenylation domain-containing protein, partial [Rhizobacter sp.]